MSKSLKVESLRKDKILNRISFELKQGSMTAIMGPSGSGKSTLLYQIAGMAQPDGGRVWLNDMEITGLSEDEKASLRLRRIGFVFQYMNMMANLSILDNILLPAIWANKGKGRKSKAELRIRAKELMRKLSISGLEERKITEVSGGQLQRACICRSMMNEPEILLADEPTGALNQSAAAEVMAELVRLNRSGTTILIVTRDGGLPRSCDRILYLLDGRICGELTMDKMSDGTEKQREEKVGRWIGEMENKILHR